jgi:tetratricopeptide (TPR) repeat protein
MNPCPSPEQFRQLLAEQVGEAERQALEAHAESCERCQKALVSLTDVSLRTGRLEPQAPSREPSADLPPDVLRRLLALPPAETPAEAATATDSGPAVIRFPGAPSAEGPLGQLDSFQILERLGQGSFGFVYKARDALGRLVAIKVLKPGSAASSEDQARFQGEARAVAAVGDEHVVTLYQVGNTPDFPLPYLVMEYIEGESVKEWLKRQEVLNPHEVARIVREAALGLAAVHGRGVVHRDVKPSNLMLQRGSDKVKVTDFGLARMVDGPGERSSLSEAIVGTPEYMSPEQIQVPQRVGARSDVYSLGVILYELLAGQPPFRGLRHLVLQQVVHDDPLPPRRLNRLISRDLETICLKCLQREPDKRYASAAALAEDLRRFLAGEPIQARPSRLWERGLKWARRRPAVAALLLVSGLAVLALVGGVIGTTVGLVRADRAQQLAQAAEANERTQRQLAEQEKQITQAVLEFVEDRIFAAARPEGQEGGLGSEVTLRQAVQEALSYVAQSFPDQPLIEARLRLTLGTSFLYLGDAKTAAEQNEAARKLYFEHEGPDHPDTLRSMHHLANSYNALGRHADALQLLEEVLALWKAKLGPDHPNTLRSMNDLAACYHALGRHAEALQRLEETLALRKAKLGPDHPDTLGSMNNLAMCYYALGRHPEALKLCEETLPLVKAKLGPDHPDTLLGMHNLANSYAALGRHADALQLHEETLALRKAKLGTNHPDTLRSMHNLANSYDDLGRQSDALKLREETLALRKAKLGPDHPDTLLSMHNLANSYQDLGRHADALKLREETLPLMKAKLGPDHPTTLLSMHNLVISYHALGRYADALKLCEETLALRKTKLGPGHPDTLLSMWGVAESRIKLERGTEAVPVIDDCVQRAAGKVVDPHLLPGVMDLRLRHFEKTKDAAGCRQTAETWEKLKRTDAASLYDAACMRAVTSAVLRATDKSAAGAKQADAEADRALAWLKQAVTAGYKNAAHMKQDKDLDALRSRPDFQQLLAELERKAKLEPSKR